MTSIYPKFPTKWETAKKIFNAKMRDFNNESQITVEEYSQ